MAGETARQAFSLTHGDDLLQSHREKLVYSLCEGMQSRFEDTTHGVIETTSVADFKMWPMDKSELEGLCFRSV